MEGRQAVGVGVQSGGVHPLLKPHALQQILHGLAGHEAPTAIIEVIRWLDSFHYEAALPARTLGRLVITLDEAAQPQLRQTAGLYLSNAFSARSLRYKALGRDFHTSLGRAYDLALNTLSADVGSGPDDELRTHLLLRTIRSAAGEMKWTAFAYEDLDPQVWLRAGQAFRMAEASGALNVPVRYREGRDTRSTVTCEFIRLVALQCAHLDQLSPERIEAADKLVRHFQYVLGLSRQPVQGSLFAVDLQGLAPPRRCLEAPAEGGNLHFFRPSEALPVLGELERTLRSAGVPPAFAGLEPEAVMATISHLARHWGPQPPRRQYRRHAVGGEVSLATGVGFIRSLLSGDAQLRPAAAWFLLDASRTGFRLQGPLFDHETCRVGALVAAQLGETGRWLLARVRRVRSEAGQVFLGLQTLSNAPQAISLDDGSRGWSGILCDAVVRGRGVRVVCEPGFMPLGHPVFARMAGRTIKFVPGQIVHEGPGYQVLGCTLG
ncbi:hypothetical protein [Zoogloea sp.]|uniref:hypothetical protein n=1 Tax=Zoogloea sp. TaxID=49181 RepID=UPI00260C67C2|nr:hypothetical protein [Zoogloea sp.]MDD3354189.1 hypothetical protein [Zoogloea sp.]